MATAHNRIQRKQSRGLIAGGPEITESHLMNARQSPSIIALDRFIQATRDSGYKGTVSAIAELVDNALQADATSITITLATSPDRPKYPIQVSVLDNGSGMDRVTLRQSLRFGGSSRFNSRSGLGRFGMGLPNASLSQAKRVDVYSWQKPNSPLLAYLDVDEISEGNMVDVPVPRRRKLPNCVRGSEGSTGTLIVWTKCDRLDHRRPSTVARKLVVSLGRMFRYFLWKGVTIDVNGTPVEPVDPLYLREPSVVAGGTQFQTPMEFEIRVPSSNGERPRTGVVDVTFSELPVADWHGLSNKEKRNLGVSNGAGVSVVRGGREIEYGWFFMGRKRRENYDDWWRCEVRFDSILDDAFGITHTKQQIRPQEYLSDILAPEMEMMAKVLNSRVRRSHSQLKASSVTAPMEQCAGERDARLTPLPKVRPGKADDDLVQRLIQRHPILKELPSDDAPIEYRIIEDQLSDRSFFQTVKQDGRLIVIVNPQHPFYKLAYGPLMATETDQANQLSHFLQALLLSAARAEAVFTKAAERDTIERFRQAWSAALAVFLRK